MRNLLATIGVGLWMGSAFAAPSVKKVPVSKSDLHKLVHTSVSAAPHLWAQVAAPVAGTIKTALVDLGSMVKKGQVLATVEPAHGGKAMSLVAPFDGVVIARNALPGVFTQEGNGLFTVIDASVIKLELEVSEMDAPLVMPGQPVTAHFDALPGASYQAKLVLVVPTIDGHTRTMHADAEVQNVDHRVIPGMAGQAQIEVAGKSGVPSIPLSALNRQDGEMFVYRLDGDKARRTKVTLGVDDGEMVEVTAGLGANDVVLVGAVKDGEIIGK
jgi:Cu(I)/Ag(I) efflux system membrane fusion protein